MEFNITKEEGKKAKFPHELFLINLITNHILLFVGLLGMMKDIPALAFVTPGISFVLMFYILIRARIEKNNPSWFIMCHWQLCAQRSRFFIGMIIFFGIIIAALLVSVGGNPNDLNPGHYAIAGVAILPTMFSVLTLIVMESDAMHQAKTGKLPKGIIRKYATSDMDISALDSQDVSQ